LVTSECANHFGNLNGTSDYCCLEWTPDHRCVYFLEEDNPRCRYFEESVLPLDKEIETAYYAERFPEVAISQDDLATCAKCGKRFAATSNRQKYCQGCRKKADRERSARYRQRMKAMRHV